MDTVSTEASARFEVAEHLSQYGLLLDQRRIDDWLALFAPEAEIDIEGRPLIRTEAGRRSMAVNSPPGAHLAAFPVIYFGAGTVDAARVEQTFLFHNLSTGLSRAGWYQDDLRREDGSWTFVNRTIRFFPA